MQQVTNPNRFYQTMGVVMLGLVFLGFGAAAIVRGQNPLTLPMLFHVHGIIYIAWFGLFIFQASLIGKNNRALHMTLGKLSPVVVAAMIITAWMMAKGSFVRGHAPIPDMSIQQFMAFPFFDLLGLIVFYSLAFIKRADADFHKRAMLLACVAIMDPATARLGIVFGVEPFPLLASILLVGAVMWYDRGKLGRIHVVTWAAMLWVFLRVAFVFGFGATDTWAAAANRLFG